MTDQPDYTTEGRAAAQALLERIGVKGAVGGDVLRDLLTCAWISKGASKA